jgi:hypothetical protein
MKDQTFGQIAQDYFEDHRHGWSPEHALQWSSDNAGGLILQGADWARP